MQDGVPGTLSPPAGAASRPRRGAGSGPGAADRPGGPASGGRLAVLDAGLPTAVRDPRPDRGARDRDRPGGPAWALRRARARAADLDRRLLAALRHRAGAPAVAAAARGLSSAGEHGALWVAAGLAGACADPGRRHAWLRATALVAGSHAASIAVKRAVRRPRPPLGAGRPLVRTAGRHGFPSSHAASSAAAAIALGALLRPGPLTPAPYRGPLSGSGPLPGLGPLPGAARSAARVAAAGPGPVLVPALRVLAAAVCVSRLVAGVHYPTDVVCGALLGATLARLGRRWSLAGVLP